MAFLADSKYSRRTHTDTIVIHCAETPANDDIGAAEIREWHIHERGWIDIGYHYVIRRNGTVEPGRPSWALPSAVQGDNNHIVAICLVGGCDAKKNEQNNFTVQQWAALRSLIAGVIHEYPTITNVKGHREYAEAIAQGKYCPSFDVPTWWPTVQEDVFAIAKQLQQN